MTKEEEQKIIDEITELTCDLDYLDEIQENWLKQKKEQEFDEDLVQGI